ncbi:MAG: DUF4040 domain-containing protein [Acidimicrobiia bacterium]|nr:DUF4040 domain-containing protein [Acidimicrobiia bacterium]
MLFAGAMAGVVTADNLFAIFVFWELTTITSFVLIGIDDDRPGARAAALAAILTTAAAGLAMLAGFVLLAQSAGTASLSAILADPPAGSALGVAMGLIAVGALAKSAQYPFHYWLPGAMAAPTPISAYLHSATMVKAGIYLLARFAPVVAPLVVWWRPAIMGVGAVTMLWGGFRALRQVDLKLLLAFGTVSQLGFLTLLLGAGYPALTFAGAAVLLAHALFKATLFLVVGIVDHQAHTRRIGELTGLAARLRPVFIITCVAAGSMAGLPPLLGFVAKEAALEGLLESGPPSTVVLVAVVAASVLTAAYSARFVWGAFGTHPATAATTPVGPAVDRPSPLMWAPAAVLATLTVVLAFTLGPTETVVASAAGSLAPAASSFHLHLWHGFTLALGLSTLAIAAGGVVFVARDRIDTTLRRLPAVVEATTVYDRIIAGLVRLAERTTAVVQSGSLPTYLAVIFGTAVALPGTAAVLHLRLPDDVALAESPLQVLVAAIIVAATVATAMAKRRFVAVLFVGAVGFGVAMLFLIQGAPDPALTQLLVETLTLVIFVLVLRHLPERFHVARWRTAARAKVVVSVAVGCAAAAMAAIAANARTAPSVSEEMLTRALPDAEGRNVVNVILVDFRGYDTMGEIAVLVVAALGIASLVLAGRRSTGERADAVDMMDTSGERSGDAEEPAVEPVW